MVQAQDTAAVLSLINDDFLKWAFRGLIVAACGYLLKNHAKQKEQDLSIAKLQHAMELNHPTRADFDAYQFRVETRLDKISQEFLSMDRMLRLVAAKMNIDVRG